MNTTMKKIAASFLALLMVIQLVPALGETSYSGVISGSDLGYREKLEIVASKGTYVLVGQTLGLDVNDDYMSSPAKWESSDESIADVNDLGLVTAKAPGSVKITVYIEGQKDSVEITVVDPDTIKNGLTGEEGQETGEQQGSAEKTLMVIVINGENKRVTYDGKEHLLDTFTAASNDDSFDPEKLHVTNNNGVSATNCGTYPYLLDSCEFSYDDASVAASFVVNNSWLRIVPAKATIVVDSKTMVEGGEMPELTASVTGLIAGDDPSMIQYVLKTETKNGTTEIIAEFSETQGNYRVTMEPGKLTVEAAGSAFSNSFPLYNIAKISNTYYRLAKTTIWTDKDPGKDPKGTLKAEDYTAEDYDFANLEIEIGGKKYLYNCKENAEAIILGANYYEANNGVVSIVKNKIGAMGKDGKPNWIVPEADQYPDKNETDSIHRDYEIKLYAGKTPAVEQTVYNMLSIDGNTSYHKLRTSKIKAQPFDTLKNGEIKAGEYVLEPYDFTNVIITIDGVEYKYNDGSLDEYENYFTVEFYDVEKVDYFNRNSETYKDKNTWLDGAFEEYGNLPNTTKALHANYKATTHKGKERPRSVTIVSDWPEGRIAYPGAEITLTATAVGFSENVRYQWQRSAGNDVWEDIPGETGITYTYILDDSTAQYSWRVAAED